MQNIIIIAGLIIISGAIYTAYFRLNLSRFIKAFLIFLYFPFLLSYLYCFLKYGRLIPVNLPELIFNLTLPVVINIFSAVITPLVIIIFYRRHYSIRTKEMFIVAGVYSLMAYFYSDAIIPGIACALYVNCN